MSGTIGSAGDGAERVSSFQTDATDDVARTAPTTDASATETEPLEAEHDHLSAREQQHRKFGSFALGGLAMELMIRGREPTGGADAASFAAEPPAAASGALVDKLSRKPLSKKKRARQTKRLRKELAARLPAGAKIPDDPNVAMKMLLDRLQPSARDPKAARKDRIVLDWLQGKGATLVDAYKRQFVSSNMTRFDQLIAEKDETIHAVHDRLDTAASGEKDDVARDIVSRLSRRELGRLPTETRNRLLQALNPTGWEKVKNRQALRRLYSVRKLDPQFAKIDRANGKKLAEAIESDPEIAKARKNWKTLSTGDRKKILKRVADLQAKIFGFPKGKLATYSKAPSADGEVEHGYYDHGDGTLRLNTRGFDDFDEVVATVVHEGAHRYQGTLIDRLNAGRIKKGHPLYQQALTFKLNDRYYADTYRHTKTRKVKTWRAYEKQPMEHHSRRLEEIVTKARKRFRKKLGKG